MRHFPGRAFGVASIPIDMAMFLAYILAMKVANIAEFKNRLSQILSLVQKGVTVEICKRNVPIARVVPLEPKKTKNKTRLGCGRGSVKIHGDLTEPMIPEDSWEMLTS